MINATDAFNIAVKSLAGNKFRTVLTTLGVIIGIFSVVTLVSIGEAGKAFIHFQISQWGTGTNYMEVHHGKKGEQGPARMLGMMDSKLTLEDVKAIAKAKHVKYAIGHILKSGQIKYGRKTYDTSFLGGTNYNYTEAFTHKVAIGRFFNKQEEALGRKVCVLGPEVVAKLFGGFYPIGEKVKINGVKFTVVGVMEKKGSMFGVNIDEYCFIPITEAQKLFDTKKIIEIGVTAVDEKSVAVAVEEVRRILLERHGEEDFRIDTLTESLELLNSILGTLTSIIGGIAAISLLVGGIGVMNIMLVSVAERTREIGIRKAVGATRRDVFSQFLVEAILVSSVGGVIGIVLGVAVSLVIMKFLNIPLIIATWAAVLALIVAVGVGIASGLYPSMRAASLDPVEALRYE